MALPPSYLILHEAAVARGVDLSRDDAIWIADFMFSRGWVVVAKWQVIDPAEGSSFDDSESG